MKTADQLATTLEWMVKSGHVPGLLPEDVNAAATLLRAQDKELTTLRAAIAANQHAVAVTAERQGPCAVKLRGEFTIVDPRLYYGEVLVDLLRVEQVESDWMIHEARRVVGAATSDWIGELTGRTYDGMSAALKKLELGA